MQEFFAFIIDQRYKLLEQTLTHIGLTFLSLCIAMVIGLPLGILISLRPRLVSVTLGAVGVLQTIPSLALLGFMIPLLGIGPGPAIVALFLYALLPIVQNTYVGIREVSPTLKEAAQGMGLTPWQRLIKLELPLALPVIFAGVRTATVINVGVATLAAYLAAGGLGEFIFSGIALNDTNMILAGTIPSALLAILFDAGLARLQHLRKLWRYRMMIVFLLLTPLLSSFYWLPKKSQTKLHAGFAHEFYGRSDGYPALLAAYDLHISSRLIDPNLMYESIHRNLFDIISGYSTDGRIKTFQLRALVDDKHAFPPYEASFMVRQATLKKYPALQPTLELLSGTLTDSSMTELNYRVDCLHESPKEVARQFLQRTGLLHQPGVGHHQDKIAVGAMIFTEQYILVELVRQLVENRLPLEVVTKTGLGGTKLCFDALQSGSLDLYPEYTGAGLLVLLKPSPRLIDSLKADPKGLYQYVNSEFNQKYGLSWLKPLVFNNTYALMMRESHAQALGIRTTSELKRYLEKQKGSL
ncbi:ABC transporter permease subunit [Spirosoma sp. HMF4905]|uniref:ABC transporter permease subunit n=1 Tax=Spirosoma arboris TaxID=2682092 RepID=A0A7K1S499_9BACT|nr:ABC transporter permease/substrate-binding protein [Spirosoma arboris]MVM28653.1 ABC transporter permease subunit [Spirosoma arboris]